MIKVLFCGYRSWAHKIFTYFEDKDYVSICGIVASPDEFEEFMAKEPELDAIVFCGWSWIIGEDVYNKYLCVGIHPSDLPMYRGGSPIQHQIIDGLDESMATLMTLGDGKIDSGDIWEKEPYSLEGDNMDIIFDHIAEASIKAIERFFSGFGKKKPETQDISKGSYRARRKPEDGRITAEMLSSVTARQLYDLIRSLTKPYPNAYFEDADGNRVMFKVVEYQSADSI